MAEEVREVGKGFITASGELKSKAQLAKEETQVITEDTVEVSPENAEERLSNAVGNARSRFREQANSVGSVINQDEANLKEAAKAVKEQLAAAKELKAALKDEDAKKTERAQERLAKATERRNEVAEKVERTNSEAVTKRVQNLNVGNEQRGIVKTKAVEFEKREAKKPEKVEDVNKLIRELKSDRESVTTQRVEARQVKQELREEVSRTEERLATTEANSIRDLRKAEETARALAERIANNQSQALAANKIKESIAQQLLQ
jgi:hypothetical protein